jgi:predicted ATPase
MPLLTGIRLTIPSGASRKTYPFSLPLLGSLKRLSFGQPVTFFCGENGSGKSTLIEALACAVGLPAIGSSDVSRDETLSHVRGLSRAITCEWARRTHRGFFLRAEDFFGFIRHINGLKAELKAEKENFGRELTGYGRSLAMGVMEGQIRALDARYGEDPDGRSHGESFIALFQSRIVPGGLYILDEPEAPLSPRRQLAFLSLMKEMVAKDCQFVVATHSPVLMAYPGAVIYDLDRRPVREAAYGDLEHVRFAREFLAAPERFLRHL